MKTDQIAACSPADVAEKLVQVVTPEPGGPWTVQLCELLDEPVSIFEHANPDVVREKAEQVRDYVAALMLAADHRGIAEA